MIDPELKRLADDHIKVAFTRAGNEIGRKAAQTISTYVMRGVLQSSMAQRGLVECYGQEFARRSQTVVQIIIKVCGAIGVAYSESLGADLSDYAVEHIKAQEQPLFKQLTAHPPFKSSMAYNYQKDWGKSVSLAIEDARAQLDLYATGLKRLTAQQQGDSGGTRLTFHGPVGAVQMGASSVANVSMVIDASAKETLTAALNTLIEALRATSELTATARTQLIDIAEDTKVEVAKETPNTSKVQMAFVWLATSIQTTAALQPAYEALKSAASALGGLLP